MSINLSGLPHDSYLSTRGGSDATLSKSLEFARFLRAFHNDQLVTPTLMDIAHQITLGAPNMATISCLGSVVQYYRHGAVALPQCFHFIV